MKDFCDDVWEDEDFENNEKCGSNEVYSHTEEDGDIVCTDLLDDSRGDEGTDNLPDPTLGGGGDEYWNDYFKNRDIGKPPATVDPEEPKEESSDQSQEEDSGSEDQEESEDEGGGDEGGEGGDEGGEGGSTE